MTSILESNSALGAVVVGGCRLEEGVEREISGVACLGSFIRML